MAICMICACVVLTFMAMIGDLGFK